MPQLARIRIYPLKSFDAIDFLRHAKVLPTGALEYDRRFALFDSAGNFVHAKRTPRIHGLRTTFDWRNRTLTLLTGGEATTYQVDDDKIELEHRLSDDLGLAVSLRENPKAGFPDDTVAPGPTVVSTATMYEVATWYPGLTVDDIRLRFRANLEIDADLTSDVEKPLEPFWEDRLYGEEGDPVRFSIGTVEFLGTNPCQRCVVPTRSPTSGERYPDFTRIFEARRYETLPPWATRSRFDHFYRLAVNTKLASSSSGGTIRIGGELRIAKT